tara:strand:+ start:348 stop:581 length:234 start_codon:yes stop_codon:yes gene_type:complete
MGHYNKKQEGITFLHGESIGSSLANRNPIARSIKARQEWQNALGKLNLTTSIKEKLNILFEEMAMQSYDMGKQSNEK